MKSVVWHYVRIIQYLMTMLFAEARAGSRKVEA